MGGLAVLFDKQDFCHLDGISQVAMRAGCLGPLRSTSSGPCKLSDGGQVTRF
jgi:hypothetical protein